MANVNDAIEKLQSALINLANFKRVGPVMLVVVQEQIKDAIKELGGDPIDPEALGI